MTGTDSQEIDEQLLPALGQVVLQVENPNEIEQIADLFGGMVTQEPITDKAFKDSYKNLQKQLEKEYGIKINMGLDREVGWYNNLMKGGVSGLKWILVGIAYPFSYIIDAITGLFTRDRYSRKKLTDRLKNWAKTRK